ncbi:hypothetical protein EIL87_01375 [Saccharopolyspora rhizosphaerae]|uniref:Uncharacterized protein n=1 Tax=Saccharopolyspora rhizosphaerae TaxID=2492662 RepID=A0A3R8PAW5_9PSEU|nr:hypothetical protein [Saccharopolyspora rhizosphaerae]RRO20563.1 hypothetical protein EIL87_01375 [Saccharopolyspora rhizosphaerae]
MVTPDRQAPQTEYDTLMLGELTPVREQALHGHETLAKAPTHSQRRDVGEDLDFPDQAPPTPPRGTLPDGTIRTTGWLQIGPVTISSGVWAALSGLAAGLALTWLWTWLPLVLAVAGVLAWWTWTRRLRPASRATNLRRLPAARLRPGMPVRLYGPIGPVGIVEDIEADELVKVTFTSGHRRRLRPQHPCHLVEVQD